MRIIAGIAGGAGVNPITQGINLLRGVLCKLWIIVSIPFYIVSKATILSVPERPCCVIEFDA
jgi:hypothetical protein